MGVVDIRTTFLAASCFPPLTQNDAFLFVYTRFSLSYSLSTSCRFSTSRRFVAASQRLIFRWKYRRRSSFFFSTPFKSKENQESWLLLYFLRFKVLHILLFHPFLKVNRIENHGYCCTFKISTQGAQASGLAIQV